MASTETIRIGKRGTVVIPASLRRAYNLDEGSFLVAEPREEGILLRPGRTYRRFMD
ncbi:MAG: AbrB/MazE/SpoVT family DNA-binding domain-containing protein [Bacillota bacterium]